VVFHGLKYRVYRLLPEAGAALRKGVCLVHKQDDTSSFHQSDTPSMTHGK
jgi:hypothetical protein